MDDLQLLRAMRSDVGSAPQATLARGRNTLMAKIGAPDARATTSGVRPRRIVRRAVLASAAAALLVGAMVAADVIIPGAHKGATAEAAEVLSRAATATIKTSDPVVKPGQYLKIDTNAVYGTTQAFADGSQLSWLERTGGQVYVPADRTGVWVWTREDRVPGTFFSDAAKKAAAKMQESVSGSKGAGAETLRAPGGAFYGGEQTVINGMRLDEAAKLPRDPKALLDLIYSRTKGAGVSPEAEALVTIADTLRTGIIPADLRASLYKAAALVPGVTMVDRQATLDGKTGVAIGIVGPDGRSRRDIIIDPATGLMIGERDVLLKATPDFPAGTATSWTSVRTTVVNAAP